MSVKLGLMALLAEGPQYGAGLRAAFEERTGGTWPLNVGQVYTTLGRLERDGLVEQAGPPDGEGRISYRLTDAGHAEVARWWRSPVDRDNTPRDELVIKLALAVSVPDVDVQGVVQTQRTATLTHLRDLTRLKHRALDGLETATAAASEGSAGVPTSASPDHDLAWLLVLENHIFSAEAEVRWLDHVETRLARVHRRASPGTTHTSSTQTGTAPTDPTRTDETADRTPAPDRPALDPTGGPR